MLVMVAAIFWAIIPDLPIPVRMTLPEQCWHNLTAWGSQADFCRQYVQKGRQIYVEGRIRYDSWTDPQGQKRFRTEIVVSNITLLGARPGERPAAAPEPQGEAQPEYGEPADAGAAAFGSDDDLPF